jgi:Glyoxalase-like domain
MRLRQIALASYDLEACTEAFNTVFGLKVAYNDPGVGHYGLKNAVFSTGTGFLEIVQPISEDASGLRFLKKRGGDAGYMLIIQTADEAAETARVEKLGVRVVDRHESKTYRFSHFYPAHFGGILTSYDQQMTETDFLKPYGDWMPAGPNWRETRTEVVKDMLGCTLANPEPDALAARWSELTGRPLSGPRTLPLDKGVITFEDSDKEGTWISVVDLAVADPAACNAAARAAGLDVNDRGVLIGGVRFRAVA